MQSLIPLAAERQADRERRIREQAPAPANVIPVLAHPAPERRAVPAGARSALPARSGA